MHRLAGFYYDYINKQVFADSPVPLLGPVSILSNIPKSKAYGIDAEATVTPAAGLTLHVAVNYTRTEVTDPGSLQLDGFGVPIDYRGHPFPYAPKISGVFDAEYRWTLAAGMEGFVGPQRLLSGPAIRRSVRPNRISIFPATRCLMRVAVSQSTRA